MPPGTNRDFSVPFLLRSNLEILLVGRKLFQRIIVGGNKGE
jgi:hypothetical protein